MLRKTIFFRMYCVHLVGFVFCQFMYPIKTPFFWKWLFPQQLWHMPRNRKVIYLTFDDGPIPVVTPWVLKTLKEFEAKATFFCIGDNVRKHFDLYKQVLKEHHAVGNHTYNHLKGSETNNKNYLENIHRCAGLVQSDLFRPPYGRIKRSQVRLLKSGVWSMEIRESTAPQISNLTPQTSHLKPHTLNLTEITLPENIVMWDVLSGDFDEDLSPEKCLQNVLRNTEPGSIVVFHDSLKAFPRLEYVLPKALKQWREMGYEFERL